MLLSFYQKKHCRLSLPSILGPFFRHWKKLLLSVCRFPKSNLGNQEKQAELTLPQRRAIGWMPSQKSLLAWFSIKIWLKPVSREIRGSGEGGRAFALCQALIGTKDARETRAGDFFFSTLQFYTSWKSHMKHSWCLTLFCFLYLRHFLKHCPLVLFLVLLKSLKELFCCSSDKSSFHDKYWGLSVSFFMHA